MPKVDFIDCELIRHAMGDRILNHPEDIKHSKSVIEYMKRAGFGCTEDTLFVVAMVNVFNGSIKEGKQIDGDIPFTIGKRYAAFENYSEALKWYNIALGLCGEDLEKKAEIERKITEVNEKLEKEK